MASIRIRIDGTDVRADDGNSLLQAAYEADCYIPSLCFQADLPASPGSTPNFAEIHRGQDVRVACADSQEYGGCGLCLVEVSGESELVHACETALFGGMIVETQSEAVQQARQRNLKKMLADHPHACILCPVREGCDRRTCSMDVPLEERCCDIFNHCQIRFVSEHIGIAPDTPKYTFNSRPIVEDEPLLDFDWNLCIGCTRCVRVCRDVRGIEALGFVIDADGQLKVGTKAPTLDESGCIFCGACLVACPSGAIMDKAGDKARDRERPVPCTEACPAGIDIPRYLRFIAEGKYSQALAVIREKVTFPGVLGYVCHHPCEHVCRREELNEPISICRLKRFAFEQGDNSWKELAQIKAETGKRVAVVGSGPAGLSAAYYLRKQGHEVSVFESLPEAGGMLRYGMPPFRLSREVLDQEIGEIVAAGVKILTDQRIASLDGLLHERFDAVFLAIGAHQEYLLRIPGEEFALSGISFLREVNLGKPVEIGDRVVVIGGGNVAADVARTALRLGSRQVKILYRRTRELMPAISYEIEHALQEGAALQELIMPLRLERNSDHLELTCGRTELGERNSKPTLVANSEFEIDCDMVITAIGQVPRVGSDFGVILSADASIQIEEATLMTNREGVFAGGDAISGAASVIEAIALGRRGAQQIDLYLGGDGCIDETLIEERPEPRSIAVAGFLNQQRSEPGSLAVQQRLSGIDVVVEGGYGEQQARFEASRCLRCDIRTSLACIPMPPASKTPIQMLTAELVDAVPSVEGVYRLYDADQNVLAIKGVPDIRVALKEQLNSDAISFDFQEESMYTQRESELLQQHLQQHGKLPGAELDELDDLF